MAVAGTFDYKPERVVGTMTNYLMLYQVHSRYIRVEYNSLEMMKAAGILQQDITLLDINCRFCYDPTNFIVEVPLYS